MWHFVSLNHRIEIYGSSVELWLQMKSVLINTVSNIASFCGRSWSPFLYVREDIKKSLFVCQCREYWSITDQLRSQHLKCMKWSKHENEATILRQHFCQFHDTKIEQLTAHSQLAAPFLKSLNNNQLLNRSSSQTLKWKNKSQHRIQVNSFGTEFLING